MDPKIRQLLWDNPLEALLQVKLSDKVSRDYLCGHLGITESSLRKHIRVARSAQYTQQQKEWSNSLLDGLPDIVLHQFACDYAIRVMVQLKRKIHQSYTPEFWAAISAKRRWMRGEVTSEELYRAREKTQKLQNIYMGVENVIHAATLTKARKAAESVALKGSTICLISFQESDAHDIEIQWQLQRLALLCKRYALGRIRDTQ